MLITDQVVSERSSARRLVGIKPKLGRCATRSAHELPKIVSLFCGAGGLDLGFHKAGFEIAMAFDRSRAAIQSHKRNFPHTESHCADLSELSAPGVVSLLKAKVAPGSAVGIIGGPPCQGFSRANAGSFAADPRNTLVPLYTEIVAEIRKHFSLKFVVFENVLGIKDAKHAGVYDALLERLKSFGLAAQEMQLCALDFGVPQTRRRVIVTALEAQNASHIEVLQRTGKRTLRDAIGHLGEPAFFSRSLEKSAIPHHPNHWTMRPRSSRFSSDPSEWRPSRSFKRTHWDRPSPTIAFGHREVHVHPSCKRRLSIHEALLLQGFPKSFVLEGTFSAQVEQVSNAVPPPLAFAIANGVKSALKG